MPCIGDDMFLKLQMIRQIITISKVGLVALKMPAYVLHQVIRDPLWFGKAIRRRWKLASAEVDKFQLAAMLTNISIDNVATAYGELRANTSLYQHLRNCFKVYIDEEICPDEETGRVGYDPAETLYLFVRALKPQIIVETGVAGGESSTFILQALEDNKVGTLYSIDLPPPQGYKLGDSHVYYLPEGKQSGWIIPDALRHRWHLVLGASSEVLSPLLRELGHIDIFLHDSLHTRENMLWEYQTAWPFINEGGLLLSHDIYCNESFIEFCSFVKRPLSHHSFLGAVTK